jgi:hypothetical protein
LQQREFMKRAALLLALASAGSSAFLLAPRAASAVEECFAPVPLYRDAALPAADATGVPLNSRVIATLSGRTHRELYLLRLRVAGANQFVTATTRDVSSGHLKSAVILTPGAPLEPATTYEILDDLDAITTCDGGPGSIPCGDAVNHLVVVSSFTTGDTLDTTPPAFAPTFQVSHAETVCDVPECCGAYHAFDYGVSFNAATDDQPVFYDVTMGNGTVPMIEGLVHNGFSGANYCYIEPSTEGGGPDIVGPGPVVVRAVDLAGNATAAPSHELQVPACPPEDHPDHDAGPYCDGGYPHGEDGGYHFDDGGVVPLHDDGAGCGVGCSVSAGGEGRGALATLVVGVLLALGALTVRSRRRR